MSQLLLALSAETGLGVQQLSEISATAPWRYKVFSIKKRNGAGERVIAQPSRELKIVQRVLARCFLAGLPVHGAVHGYVKGRGIKTNAEAHLQSRFLLKVDFRDFFPSIIASDFLTHLEQFGGHKLDARDYKTAARLIFWAPKGQHSLRLCIGAPTSPFISNTIMYSVDVEIADFCASCGVTYTRYADDLTFSTSEPGVLVGVLPRVRSIIAAARYPRLSVNEHKTVNASKAHKRVVTGVVLSSAGSLSLGYARKRAIRAMAHRFSLRTLSVEEAEKLHGLLAFADDVDPVFSSRMRERFGVFRSSL